MRGGEVEMRRGVARRRWSRGGVEEGRRRREEEEGRGRGEAWRRGTQVERRKGKD